MTAVKSAQTDLEVINYLINSEMQLASYMMDMGLRLASPSSAYLGFSAYFMKGAKHSHRKAIMAAFFIQEIGGNFTFSDIKAYNQNITDPVAALDMIIGLEESILGTLRTSMINDPGLKVFIDNCIKEKAIHIGVKKTFMTKLMRVHNNPDGLDRINDELLLIDVYAKHHHKHHGDKHHHHHRCHHSK